MPVLYPFWGEYLDTLWRFSVTLHILTLRKGWISNPIPSEGFHLKCDPLKLGVADKPAQAIKSRLKRDLRLDNARHRCRKFRLVPGVVKRDRPKLRVRGGPGLPPSV